MPPIRPLLPVLCLSLLVLEAAEPCFWLAESRLTRLRELVAQDHPDIGRAFSLLQARVDAGDDGIYQSDRARYRHSIRAREAAFLARFHTDPDRRRHYAAEALAECRAIYTAEDDSDMLPEAGKGLGRAMLGLGIAMAWNWAGPWWSEADQDWARGVIERSLDGWARNQFPNVKRPYTSNWVAVCRGTELIQLLVADQREARAERYERVTASLVEHIEQGFGDLGVSQEGLGYTEYPGGFLIPAILAARQAGDDRLWQAAQQKQWWKLAMYAQSFQGFSRKFIHFGVDVGGYNEGWVSLLAATVPAAERGAWRWFYDRHMGRLSRMGDLAFDGHRGGTIWALLYYPDDHEPDDPTGHYPSLVVDSHGYALFRNRWRDADDVQATIAADLEQHRGWNQAEGLALNLLAFDHRFIGGPGKNREAPFYSGLLIDGRWTTAERKRPSDSGPWTQAAFPDGAAVRVLGGRRYAELGIDRLERQWAVQAGPDADQVVLATFDHFVSAEPHQVTWQANVEDDTWSVERLDEAGCATIALRGRDDAWMKAWIVYPPEATWSESDDPIAATVEPTADGRLWMVCAAGRGEPSRAQREGTGLAGRLQVGQVVIELVGDDLRVIGPAGTAIQAPPLSVGTEVQPAP